MNMKSMRGARGSYAYSHAGLESFWQYMASQLEELPAEPADGRSLAALDAWLSSPSRRLLVAGAECQSTTLLIARWAVALASRNTIDLAFLPISPCYGTAIEREALQLLVGLLPEEEPTMFTTPRTPNELRWYISYALDGDLDSEDNPRLIIIDGMDRAADWGLDDGVNFLQDIGKGTNIVVTFTSHSAPESYMEWKQCLGWEQSNCQSIFVPAHVHETGGPAITEGNLALDALATVVAPISHDDLGVCFQCREDLAAFPDGLVTGDSNGAYHFANDTVRRNWYLGRDPQVIARLERRLVDDGLRRLAAGGGETELPVYLIQYLGAHMRRCSAPRQDLIRLVTPQWLNQWLNLPNALVGFTTDLRRARAAAETDLRSLNSPEARYEPLQDLLWCSLVEASLIAKYDANAEEDSDCAGPRQAPRVDVSVSSAGKKFRVELLMTLAELLRAEAHVVDISASVEAAKRANRQSETVDAEFRLHAIPGLLSPAQSPTDEVLAPNTHDVEWLLAMAPGRLVAQAGVEEALVHARKCDILTRTTGLAQLVPFLPETQRAEVVEEVMADYWLHGDADMLRAVLGCAAWMSDSDALRLLVQELGNGSHGDYEQFLVGWGGLTDLTALLWRLGGPKTVVALAFMVVEVGDWLP